MKKLESLKRFKLKNSELQKSIKGGKLMDDVSTAGGSGDIFGDGSCYSYSSDCFSDGGCYTYNNVNIVR